MNAARKFMFETSFDDGTEEEEPHQEEFVEDPAPVTFTHEQVEAARAEGYAVGHRAATDEEQRSTSRAHAEAAERLASRIERIDGELHELSEAVPRQAVSIGIAILRRMIPDFVRREGTSEMEALIRECLRELVDEPRLVVRVAESAFDTINGILTPLTTRAGFAGRVVLLADEALGESDCLIEWPDGGTERNLARAWREIDLAVARVLSPPPALTPASAEESARTRRQTGHPSDDIPGEGTGENHG